MRVARRTGQACDRRALQSLRVEAARNRVKVSALCPGVVRTPLLVGDKQSLRCSGPGPHAANVEADAADGGGARCYLTAP